MAASTAFAPFKVPKVPKLLLPAYQLQFSADSGRLFIASARGSVHVLQLLEPGGCKHLHMFRPPSGSGWWGAGWVLGVPGLQVPSPLWVQGGVQGQACPPFSPLGGVNPSTRAASALWLCHPCSLTWVGERGHSDQQGGFGSGCPLGVVWGSLQT